MYKLLLISRYLTRKLAPMFAGLAVMLCTAMVIIVISVMGGFLDMLRDAAKQLTGDVVVSAASITGFPHYEELIDRVEALDAVDTATPLIRSFGLLQIGDRTRPVQVEGVRPASFDRVVPFEETLHWSPAALTDRQARGMAHPGEAQRAEEDNRSSELYERYRELAMELGELQPFEDEPPLDAAVFGIEVAHTHTRDEQGRYDFANAMVGGRAVLTVVPLSEKGTLGAYEPRRRELVVVNEFKSGLYEVDEQTVFVGFDALQQWLEMDRQEASAIDPETGEPLDETVVTPARASEVAIAAAPGYTPEQAAAAVREVAIELYRERTDMPYLFTRTWEQEHAQLLAAVQNEKGMVTFLFVVISVVAVVMVAVTFYTTVVQKTRDVGTLRAIGAGRGGVLAMFLGYGLALGFVGAALGFALAWLIVTNLNAIQYWLANALGVTVWLAGLAALGLLGGLILGATVGWFRGRILRRLGGCGLGGALLLLTLAAASLLLFADLAGWLNANVAFVMWDPKLYFFDRIPDRVNHVEAALIVIGAVLSSVIGAIIPAMRAALVDPVEALRYE